NGVSGLSLLGPDGTYRVTENSPPIVNVPADTSVEIVPAAAPEPVADTAVDETSEPVATDTDGDGVVDSDEVDLYGTDPGNWDSDGDDLSDSEELFVTGTDPRLWSRKTAPVPQSSIATMTASPMPTRRASARTPPPRTPTAMATTTVTK
ncbi:MAG: fibronectin type domain protein, partial [Thermomicrobiales bacterium]|nr:fibronectin type domain protein [Thermomicrobiales bacterium]